MRLTIGTDGPARVEVRDSAGQLFQPDDALMDRTAGDWPHLPAFYQGHFVSPGTAVLEVPAGQYRVIVEKGLEFERLDVPVDLTTDDQELSAVPRRWAHAAADGWWSADFHLHRPVEDATTLLRAEDLNLGVFITTWNDRSRWDDHDPPADPVVTADPTHVATVLNAEDERGGGAWMLHNLRRPLTLGHQDWWYPPGKVFVEEATADGAWFDCEKPIWWEVPVMAALTPFDSLGILNNHYVQYGMNAEEAWGRPRDEARYPGPQGFSDYVLSLYYRYLNLGHRLPVSAGSASGVLPAPPGYNRVYTHVPAGFSVQGYYENLHAGRNFVTNGPLLTFTVNDRSPGDTIRVAPGRPVRVAAHARSRDPIDRIEIVANGQVIAEQAGDRLETELDVPGLGWLVARTYLATDWSEPGSTVRLAHSSPVYLSGSAQHWDTTEDNAYFARWIEDLIAETTTDQGRFASTEQRDEMIRLYQAALSRYR